MTLFVISWQTYYVNPALRLVDGPRVVLPCVLSSSASGVQAEDNSCRVGGGKDEEDGEETEENEEEKDKNTLVEGEGFAAGRWTGSSDSGWFVSFGVSSRTVLR